MDPEANLREQREIRTRLLNEDKHFIRQDALRLAELAEAMDEWLAAGGFLPNDWSGFWIRSQ